jgi:hypothetical protein
MPQEKTKSEDMIPQADKQAHTDIAKEGAQARAINRQQAEDRKEERKKD